MYIYYYDIDGGDCIRVDDVLYYKIGPSQKDPNMYNKAGDVINISHTYYKLDDDNIFHEISRLDYQAAGNHQIWHCCEMEASTVISGVSPLTWTATKDGIIRFWPSATCYINNVPYIGSGDSEWASGAARVRTDDEIRIQGSGTVNIRFLPYTNGV